MSDDSSTKNTSIETPVAGIMSPEQLDAARLWDDAFMRACFLHDRKTVEYVLRTVLAKPELNVLDIVMEKLVKNPYGHSVRFDVYAEDKDGSLYVIEIQRVSSRSGDKAKRRFSLDTLLKRALYDLERLGAFALKEREPYSRLRRHCVIYLLEEDIVGDGEPIHNLFLQSQQNSRVRTDIAEIILVNGSVEMGAGDTDLARLVYDFAQTEPDRMHESPLRDTVEYFKKTKEGRIEMVGTLQDYLDQQIDLGVAAGIEKEKQKIERDKKKVAKEKEKVAKEKKKNELVKEQNELVTKQNELVTKQNELDKRQNELVTKQNETERQKIATDKRKIEAFGAIRLAQQLGLSDDIIVEHLRTNFEGLTQREATTYLNEFENMESDEEPRD